MVSQEELRRRRRTVQQARQRQAQFREAQAVQTPPQILIQQQQQQAAIQSQLSELEKQRAQALAQRDEFRSEGDRLRGLAKASQGDKDTALAFSRSSNLENLKAQSLDFLIKKIKETGGTFSKGEVQQFLRERQVGRAKQQLLEARASRLKGRALEKEEERTKVLKQLREQGIKFEVLQTGEIKLKEKVPVEKKIVKEILPPIQVPIPEKKPVLIKKKKEIEQLGKILLKPEEVPEKEVQTLRPIQSLLPTSQQESIRFAEELFGVKDSGVVAVTREELKEIGITQKELKKAQKRKAKGKPPKKNLLEGLEQKQRELIQEKKIISQEKGVKALLDPRFKKIDKQLQSITFATSLVQTGASFAALPGLVKFLAQNPKEIQKLGPSVLKSVKEEAARTGRLLLVSPTAGFVAIGAEIFAFKGIGKGLKIIGKIKPRVIQALDPKGRKIFTDAFGRKVVKDIPEVGELNSFWEAFLWLFFFVPSLIPFV